MNAVQFCSKCSAILDSTSRLTATLLTPEFAQHPVSLEANFFREVAQKHIYRAALGTRCDFFVGFDIESPPFKNFAAGNGCDDHHHLLKVSTGDPVLHLRSHCSQVLVQAGVGRDHCLKAILLDAFELF